jgi:hypothetical protein
MPILLCYNFVLEGCRTGVGAVGDDEVKSTICGVRSFRRFFVYSLYALSLARSQQATLKIARSASFVLEYLFSLSYIQISSDIC